MATEVATREEVASLIKRVDPESQDVLKQEAKKEHESVLKDGFGVYLRRSLHAIFFGSYLNILLVCIPPAMFGWFAGWPEALVFTLACVSLVPIAERISFVTDEVSKYTSDVTAGLLNATMGNVPELMVAIFALKRGLLRLVQVSLIGSILSNCLLVLGTAFVVGAMNPANPRVQKFSAIAATTNSGCLMLAVACMLFPALLKASDLQADSESILNLAHYTAFFMLVLYGFFMIYQMKTHASLFADTVVNEEGVQVEADDDDDDEEPVLGFWGSVFWCAVITAVCTLCSEIVVDTIEVAALNMGLPILFIGTILLPIFGNAAEHSSAIIFAYKNRMNVSLGIAFGSATQIALFLIPSCVIAGWMMGQPLSLDFHLFEVVLLLVTVFIISFITVTGETDWLKGSILVIIYCIVAGAIFVQHSPKDMNK